MNIINLLRQQKRLQETLVLGIMSVLCFAFSLFRMGWTQHKTYLFLNWNLFLAFVPWALSSLLIVFPKLQNRPILVFSTLGSWLLFFPNAPYILTDLFHLRLHGNAMPAWFDLTLILCFAWTGLIFGFMSLWDIEKVLAKYMKPVYIPILSSGLLFLTSFGIYLGRYLRWNSWDIIREPLTLVYDVSDRFINPVEHPRTWGMTIFMGLMLNMMYWSLRLVRKRAL
jgi:uncharacterized membrane protein